MPRSTRKLQISLVARRQKPGTGSAAEFLKGRTASMHWPDLTPALGDIPWCAVGAVATRHYMPERSTQDLDAAILAKDASLAKERLAAAGYTCTGPLSIGGSSWQAPSDGRIDILELREPWAGEAMKAAQTNRDGQGLPIMPLPFLVITKLDASRHQDVADLARMLGQADEAQLRGVREAVARWRPDDSGDVEALIASGRWELGR